MLDSPGADTEEMIDAVLAEATMQYLAFPGVDPGPDYEAWLKARIPQAIFELHPGKGHFVHLADPEAFAERVLAFIA